MIISRITRFYNALLQLYPRNFQAEFGEEMAEVFSQAAEEAYAKSTFALVHLCLAELVNFPSAAVRARLQPQTSRQNSSAVLRQSQPLEQSWKELALALLVFLLPAVLIMTNRAPGLPVSIGLPAAFLFLAVMITIGWLGGFPLWSIPYIGIVLVISAYLHLFQWIAGLVSDSLIANFSSGPWDRSAYIVLEIAATGMMWLMLFCLTLLVVALLVVFNRFQPLLKRVRNDWSLLSYVLYGESVFALILLFENHHSDLNYAIASLLCLLTGVWFYLRSSARWRRLLALVSCLTLAVGIAVLEKWRLSPQGGWQIGGLFIVSQTKALLVSWIWMVIGVLLPALLSRLPSRSTRSPATDLK
jgi:hypothetical protein